MTRAEKLALLGKMITGQANPQQIQRIREERAPWFTVVTNNGDIQPLDLVEVYPRDGGGVQVITFAEFERNLALYKPSCIQVDDQVIVKT